MEWMELHKMTPFYNHNGSETEFCGKVPTVFANHPAAAASGRRDAARAAAAAEAEVRFSPLAAPEFQ